MTSPPNTDTEILITLDGAPYVLRPGTSLAALLEQLGHGPDAVGTAVNGRFVPRPLRADRLLCTGDDVLLFQAIVGG